MNILFLVCVVDMFLKIQTVTCEINQLSFLHYHPTRKETYCSRRPFEEICLAYSIRPFCVRAGTSLKYSEICLHVPNTNTFCLVRGITRNLEVRLRTIWINIHYFMSFYCLIAARHSMVNVLCSQYVVWIGE